MGLKNKLEKRFIVSLIVLAGFVSVFSFMQASAQGVEE